MGGAGFLDRATGPYTALPVTIFSLGPPARGRVPAPTAAAIVVLLVVLLTVNAAAILLRNRFERKW